MQIGPRATGFTMRQASLMPGARKVGRTTEVTLSFTTLLTNLSMGEPFIDSARAGVATTQVGAVERGAR
jgi:hypothetical protein